MTLGKPTFWILLFLLAAQPTAAAPDASSPAADAAYDPLFDDGWPEDDTSAEEIPDPWEPVNRRTHQFNKEMDTWFLRPVTNVYGQSLPKQVKLSVMNFFENLGEPATFLNDLMQREWDDAAITFSRFLVNTTIGVAGFFDPARVIFDMDGHNSDFGQTLALAGVPTGPYVVLPLMGPNNLRDSTGLIVDLFIRPTFWLLGPTEYIVYTTFQGTGHGIALRERHARNMSALEGSSIDYYTSLRNAYGQGRESAIWARRESHR